MTAGARRLSPALVAIVLAILAAPSAAHAVTNTFVGGAPGAPNDWHVPTNWSLGVVPTATHDVVVPPDDPTSNDDHTFVEVEAADAVANSIDHRGSGLNIQSGRTLTLGTGASFLDTNAQMVQGGTLRLNGTTNWAGKTWLIDDGTIENAGTLNITGNPTFAGNPGEATFRNLPGATINKTSSNTAHIRGLDNDGAVSVQAGKLIVDDSPTGGQSGGSFAIAAPGTLEFGPHPFTLGSTASVTGLGTARFHAISGVTTVPAGATYSVGTTDFNDGTLDLAGAGSTGRLIVSNTGTRRGAGTLTVGSGASGIGSMTFRDGLTQFEPGGTTSASSPVAVTQGGLLRLGGTTTWSGGGWSTDSNGSRIENAGTLDVTGDTTYSGGGKFHNLPGAAINRTTSTGTATLERLENDGTLSVQTGRFDLRHGAAGEQSSGSYSIASGARIAFGGHFAAHLLGPTASISGAGAARFVDLATTTLAAGATYDVGATEIDSGTLRLDTLTLDGGDVLRGGSSGMVDGDVANVGGTVAPGSSTATLTISGDYTQGAGGTLVSEVNGTSPGGQFDQLQVGGAATLDGTLQIVNGAGHDPSSSATFKVVQAPSRSGAFDIVNGRQISPTKEYSVMYRADGAELVVAQDLVVTDCDDPALATVTEVTGDLIAENVPNCDAVELPNLTQVGGDVSIEGNGQATTIDIGSLVQTSGDLSITDNDAANTFDIGSLVETTGDLSITGNDSASAIDINDYVETTGDISITGNDADTTVDIGSITDVGGDLTVESAGSTFNINDVTDVGGDLTLIGNGTDVISTTTGGGTTDVTVQRGTASMHVVLPSGTFSQPVRFEVEREGDGPPESGGAPGGGSATVDPLGGYRFNFAVPSLGQPAALDFIVDLAQLDPTTRDALLAGVQDGSATTAVKGDAAGSQYQAFPHCGPGQTPQADGCVVVSVLDAARQPVSGGGEPAYVRFAGVAGHFSTYAIALVRRPQTPGADPDSDSGPGGDTPPPVITDCPNAIRGTARRDVLKGTAGGDDIKALGGNDVLGGLGSRDCLQGGKGKDRIVGAGGADTLIGGPGADKLAGGRGSNAVAGGAGNDRVNAVNGKRDTVNCGRGRDRVRADARDRLRGCERVRRVK